MAEPATTVRFRAVLAVVQLVKTAQNFQRRMVLVLAEAVGLQQPQVLQALGVIMEQEAGVAQLAILLVLVVLVVKD
jgi:hypothetical protein